MKKNIIIISSISVLLLIFLSYFGYYIFLLKDEFPLYMQKLPSITKREAGKRMSLEINVYDWNKENCEISYCLLNSCDNKITLPCDKMIKNTFQEKGIYTLSLNFEKYPLFPLSKTYLKNWEVTREEDIKEVISRENYLNGVIEVLKNHSLRQGYACLIPREGDTVDEWLCDEENSFNNDYLKSIYLTYELGTKLKNETLLSYVKDEIDYLNKNREEILKKGIIYPEAYILKLIDIGLNEGYKEIIDNFVVTNTQKQVIEDHDFMPLVSINSEIYSKSYSEIVRYGDYHKIFEEYKESELSNYYSNELIREYNVSEYVLYGLCTVGYSLSDSKTFKYVKEKLEDSIREGEEVLILDGVPELLMCDKYAKLMKSEIVGVDGIIKNAVNKASFEMDGNGFIITASTSCPGEEEICSHILLNYRLVDNLMYLLYE